MYTQLDSDIYRRAAELGRREASSSYNFKSRFEQDRTATSNNNLKQIIIKSLLRKSFVCLIIIFVIFLLKNTTGPFANYIVTEIKEQVVLMDYEIPSTKEIEQTFNNSLEYLNNIK